jgi:hypothetical protein
MTRLRFGTLDLCLMPGWHYSTASKPEELQGDERNTTVTCDKHGSSNLLVMQPCTASLRVPRADEWMCERSHYETRRLR